MHWHCYTWTGIGDDLKREAERRPALAAVRPAGTAYPIAEPDPGLFTRSPLPPMRTGDWLAKPASRIAATCHDLGDALGWLRQQYTQASRRFRHPDPVGRDAHLENARDLMPRGIDTYWEFWLADGLKTAIAAICCPNRHTAHPCPTER